MRVVSVLLLSVLLSSGTPPINQAAVTFTMGDGSMAERAIRAWIARRAAAGDLDAEYHMVAMELLAQRPYTVAARRAELEALAARGHAGAASLLAGAFISGQGVPRDHDEAARWLARAAELGDEGAARDLAAYDAFVAR